MRSVRTNIQLLFKEMNAEVERIVDSSYTADMATKRILDYVPQKVATAAEGYMIDIYKELSTNTLNEPLFKSAENANKFYALRLRQRITTGYRFNVKDLKNSIKGKQFNQMNMLYSAALTGGGCAAASGILLGIISSLAEKPMPIAGIIAGAFFAGLASAGIYVGACKVKKKNYSKAVCAFMADLEKELLAWVDSVIGFYNSEVNKLKATL